MRDLAVTVCHRALPAESGARHPVTSLLEEWGFRVAQQADGPIDVAATEVLLMWGNANWFPVICRQVAVQPKAARPLMVVWHSEPLPPPRAASLPSPRLHLREIAKVLFRDSRATDVYTNYLRLRRLWRKGLPDLLLISTLGRHEFLAECGIPAHWVPLGYHPFHGRDMSLPRDIAVLLLGTLDVPRRRRLVERLRSRGVPLTTAGSWYDPACWGEGRTRLLNRAKIILNLQRYPGQLSGLSLILGMANKALVVSEPIYRPDPYVPGRHYVSARVEEMPEVIDYYLAHDDERACIVNEGYRLVTGEVTMARSLSRILDLIREQLAARARPAP